MLGKYSQKGPGRQHSPHGEARNQATRSMTLRGLAAVYLLYLTWELGQSTVAGKAPLADWLSWLLTVLFGAAAAAMAVWSWRAFRVVKAEREALARLEEEAEEDQE